MDDLIAFLNARLDEDEALARQAAQVAGPDWTWKTEVPEGYGEPTDYVTTPDGTLLLDTMGGIEGDAPHVARHDPARVLREVEAKRAIVGWHVPVKDCEPPQCIICLEYVPCRTLRALAAVYSDHPDYRAEWKP